MSVLGSRPNHGVTGAWHGADACVSTVGVQCGDVLSVTAGSPVKWQFKAP